MEKLIGISHYYGSDPDFVLAGGGNTSVKIGDRLFVKGSGSALATADANSFVELKRGVLDALLDRDLGTDVPKREEAFKETILAARVHPEKGQRPSVESALHNLMPGQFVVHTHPTLPNMLTYCEKGEAVCREMLGDQVLWVPYVTPGYILANYVRKQLKEYAKRTGRARPAALLMQSHGFLVSGDTPDEVRANTDLIIGKLRERLGGTTLQEPFGPVNRLNAADARTLINTFGPALRGLLATGERLKIVRFDDSDLVMSLVGAQDGRSIAMDGAFAPDQIVYCNSFPLWIEASASEKPDELIARLRSAISEHHKTTLFPPYVILVKGLGMFTAGDDVTGAENARLLYRNTIEVAGGAHKLGGIQYMTTSDREFIEGWEVESYRKKVAALASGKGRAAGKVAVVTGAAQGFGLEIAQDLAKQGACVVLADLNIEGVKKAVAALSATVGSGRVLGVAMNVTDGDSAAEAIHQTIRAFGGFDLFVSNAGVLKAESVKTQSTKDFDFVTAVNYKGFFLCVQKAAPALALQHRAKPDYWSDIIQINSKSGLTGSNRNGAYAGSKFGGIGLAQSFAMELVEDGIKVNAICPGNFFDGPLWSDPTNGLFVQYLRTGKVPGAKTIADVKKSYEAKVPMGRGCTTPDVMKAIYYLMEQLYETGQAVPVTGGQVMLH
jgi:rhamnose utilization protein RhaD (predicted bifunctional aldolase and dehydrogenase)/NAD(P)-dependent dehydrogenase (short-subunit alcohol dehydrogenase family)